MSKALDLKKAVSLMMFNGRDNDQDARLWRLEAFILTRRAVYAKSITVGGKGVSIDAEKMVAGTKVFIGGSSEGANEAREEPGPQSADFLACYEAVGGPSIS